MLMPRLLLTGKKNLQDTKDVAIQADTVEIYLLT